jgi:hypothetical protein
MNLKGVARNTALHNLSGDAPQVTLECPMWDNGCSMSI